MWERRAGTVAAHRERVGHDDETSALGEAPKAGQTEAYASWRSAWRALGRPEADRDELELSEGRLRMRVRAWEREKAWAPRYVANELAATRQTAERYRNTATLRTAEAAAASGDDRSRLEREAGEAAALAEVLDGRAAELEVADDARVQWLLHTAMTRATADRASAELTSRHAGDEAPEPEVTAEEWLAAHEVSVREEDTHREVTSLTDEPSSGRSVEPVEDIRDIAADEPAPVNEDLERVPGAEESAEAVRQAQRALAEIQARDADDAERVLAETRVDQLARWHVDDQAADESGGDELDDGAAFEPEPAW